MMNQRLICSLILLAASACSTTNAPSDLIASDTDQDKKTKQKLYPEDEVIELQKKQMQKQHQEIDDLKRQQYYDDRLRSRYPLNE